MHDGLGEGGKLLRFDEWRLWKGIGEEIDDEGVPHKTPGFVIITPKQELKWHKYVGNKVDLWLI